MKLIPKLLFVGYIACTILLLKGFQLAHADERNKVIYFNDIDGLPRNIITCIEQDKYGYTWLGTANGISRFNGDVFKNYEQLEGHVIRSIDLDSNDNLWVASENGLYSYNRITDLFELKYEGYIHELHINQDKVYFNNLNRIFEYEASEVREKVNANNIRSFYVNSKGIWYSASKGGIYFRPHSSSKSTIQGMQSGSLFYIIREVNGHLFFGNRSGQLFVLKDGEKEIELKIKNHHSIQEIIQVDNEYWIATDGNGIIILNEHFQYLRSLGKGPLKNSRLKSNSIYDVFLGSDNEVWVATYGAGLACMMQDNSPFNNIVPEVGNWNSLIASEGVTAFKKDGDIYFGTNYGMSVLDEASGRFTNYGMRKLKKDLLGTKVLAINTDDKDNFWIGTYDGLLGKYSPDFKFIKSYVPSGKGQNDMQRIVFIEQYDVNNLLVLTHYQNRSVLKFDLKNESFTPITLNLGARETSDLNVVSIRKNIHGETLILLRTRGLFSINIKDQTLENNLPEINKRLTFRLVDFYQDSQGFYWLATHKDGLVRMSEDGRVFDKWTKAQGLPTNTLLRIESTDDKHLWISTISGLCRFDMKTGEVLNFNHGHGLPATEFTQRASATTEDGKIIFGSNAGFTIVDPTKTYKEHTKTEVVISDISFQNRSIKNLDEPILKAPIEETKKIVLPFSKNSFTVHFFTKSNILPKYHNYAYRLAGLEEEWIYLGKNKQTTYTQLSPGTYTFQVKGSNNSNIWSNAITQLEIIITPPWYATWYAYLLYILLFSGAILSLNILYANRIRLKKEVEMSEFQLEKEHELTEKKLAFFTNISHDLKTPLTLIDAPVNDLLDAEELSAEQKNKLHIVKRNSQRLYKLISDILSFRKLTQKKLPLKVSELKIDATIETIYEAFKAECDKKHIDFHLNNSFHHPAFLDIKIIEQILWNLLSNALKFTGKNRKILLSAEAEIKNDKTYLKLIVKDSGIGIPEDQKEKIFERFYQKNNGAETRNEGTGIGLSIVKELAELHHGTISLDSSVGIGSTFTLIIPTEKTDYSDDEINNYITETGVPSPLRINRFEEELSLSDKKNHHYNLPILLLVEDNRELREYMANYFSKYYKVFQAVDGVEGLEMVNLKKPDVIITDILMPNMDGYEFCKAIRDKFDTSHLPIIMLTANSMIEHQIEGLNAGADAYISKPFDIKYLDTLVISILNNRKKIRNRILGMSDETSGENKLTEKDAEFVNELKNYITNNMSNPHLRVELLAEHFGSSRTQINRKIKSLTGQTPNNLIKSVRLRTAYELIHDKGVLVSEAAYKTGFSDPNYFTICFKKEFGQNPSQIVSV